MWLNTCCNAGLCVGCTCTPSQQTIQTPPEPGTIINGTSGCLCLFPRTIEMSKCTCNKNTHKAKSTENTKEEAENRREQRERREANISPLVRRALFVGALRPPPNLLHNNHHFISTSTHKATCLGWVNKKVLAAQDGQSGRGGEAAQQQLLLENLSLRAPTTDTRYTHQLSITNTLSKQQTMSKTIHTVTREPATPLDPSLSGASCRMLTHWILILLPPSHLTNTILFPTLHPHPHTYIYIHTHTASTNEALLTPHPWLLLQAGPQQKQKWRRR
jgi:hypothetical protein